MDEEVAARTRMNEARQRIIVDDVKFDGPTHVSDAVRCFWKQKRRFICEILFGFSLQFFL